MKLSICELLERKPINFVTVRLSQMDPTDLHGIPMPIKDKKTGEYTLKFMKPDNVVFV